MPKNKKPVEFDISKIKGLPLPLSKFDADKMAKDHEQFEAWLRGETDEPPECMKIRDTNKIDETDRIPDNHPFKSMCGVALDLYIKKVMRKKKQKMK